MILKYIAAGILLFVVAAVDFMLWAFCADYVKQKDSNYTIITLVGALSVLLVLLYLLINPLAWIPFQMK